MATADFHLKFESNSIKGESMQKGYEGQLQLQSFSWGSTNSGSPSEGSGLGSGKVSLQDFHFVIHNGEASVQLALHNWNGKHFTEITFSARKVGGGGTPYEYYSVTFYEALISSFQEGGSETGGKGGLPTCQISVAYSKINCKYFTQKQNGQVAQTHNVTYSAKTGVAEGA